MPRVEWRVRNQPSWARFWNGVFANEAGTVVLSTPENTPPPRPISEPLIFNRFLNDVGFWAFIVTDNSENPNRAEVRTYPEDGTVRATDGTFTLDWNTGRPVSGSSDLLIIGGLVVGIIAVAALASGSRRGVVR